MPAAVSHCDIHMYICANVTFFFFFDRKADFYKLPALLLLLQITASSAELPKLFRSSFTTVKIFKFPSSSFKSGHLTDHT